MSAASLASPLFGVQKLNRAAPGRQAGAIEQLAHAPHEERWVEIPQLFRGLHPTLPPNPHRLDDRLQIPARARELILEHATFRLRGNPLQYSGFLKLLKTLRQ